MKITYTPNPLDTVVELDRQEIDMFRLKIKLQQYEEMIFSAYYTITSRLEERGSLKAITAEEAMKEARKELDPDYWCNDEADKEDHSKLDSRVELLLDHYIADLKSSHVGDCTCVPASCSKCHAEQLLGIDTLKPYPGKHQLHQIASVFSRWNVETKQHDLPEVTLGEAIEKLSTYTPKANWLGWESHADRWACEAKEAHEYLINYRNKHFPKEWHHVVDTPQLSALTRYH